MVALFTLVGEEHPVQLKQASYTKERWLVLMSTPRVEEVTTNVCQKILDKDTQLLGSFQV